MANMLIEISESELKALVQKEICAKTGQEVSMSDIKIQVKSKQNYKSEWETAAFKAEYSGQI